KERLDGAPVSAAPNDYQTKERAVRVCENTYAVGDSVGMCRFTTKLFNSPSLPGLDEFANQIGTVTGRAFSPADLDGIGHNVMGVERLINGRLGVRRGHYTLHASWVDTLCNRCPDTCDR